MANIENETFGDEIFEKSRCVLRVPVGLHRAIDKVRELVCKFMRNENSWRYL